MKRGIRRLFKQRREDPLAYDMFDLEREAYDAKKGKILKGIYHRGQDRAWDGVEVLKMLVDEYGPPVLPDEQREALSRVFAIILWGELAAWKISAQLADELEPLAAKMAATSQAHDEARHFYSMYDYLKLLGYVPKRIDRLSERVLDYTLAADSLAHKMLGMQLMIETIALTLFQTVRESRVEPVLAEMLRYFEIDEARHVALGVNYLPTLIKNMNRREHAQFLLFQVKLMYWTLASLRALQPDLQKLGIDARDITELGKAKQIEVFKAMWANLGVDIEADRPMVGRVFDAASEYFFPRDPDASTWEKLKVAWQQLIADEMNPDEEMLAEAKVQFSGTDTVLPGMGVAGRRSLTQRRKRKRLRDVANKTVATENRSN